MSELPVSDPAPSSSSSSAAAEPRDLYNRVFDPLKFRVGADGKPEFDSLHRFKNIRGGAPRKDGTTSRGGIGPKPQVTPDFSDVNRILNSESPGDELPKVAQTEIVDEYTAAAVACVSAISTVAILGMGAHVAPSQDQLAAMVKAYAECFRHYGYIPKTPPWLGPVIATGVWLGPHLQDQRSQEKLQGWKARLAALLGRFRGRRDARVAAQVATAAAAVPGSP